MRERYDHLTVNVAHTNGEVFAVTFCVSCFDIFERTVQYVGPLVDLISRIHIHCFAYN